MSITNSVRVSAALVAQHAMRMRRIIICGLHRSTIFFPHYVLGRFSGGGGGGNIE
jgi:hypothetical protein